MTVWGGLIAVETLCETYALKFLSAQHSTVNSALYSGSLELTHLA